MCTASRPHESIPEPKHRPRNLERVPQLRRCLNGVMIEADSLEYPQTVKTAVAALVELLDDQQKAEVVALAKDDLIELHFGLGQYVRNAFGLWGSNPELLDDCARERASQRGDPDSQALMIHPDDAAMLLLEILWHRLHC
jgi:hypothetical protein